MRFLQNLAYAAILLAAFGLGSIRASIAHGDSVPVIAAISGMQSAITAAINNAITSQIKNLLDVTQKASSAQATFQSEKINLTMTEIARGEQAAAAQNQLRRDAAKLKEDMKLPPYACQTLAATNARATASNVADVLAMNQASQLTYRALQTENSAAAASKLYWDTVRAGGVPAASASVFLGTRTFTPTQVQQKVPELFIASVTDPAPPEKLPSGWAASPQGRAYEAQLAVYQQTMGLAQHSLSTMAGSRLPVSGAGARAGLSTANASLSEIERAEVEKRTKVGDYTKTLIGSYTSPLPVLKEMALMQATDLSIDQKALERLERMEAIMAAQLAMDVRDRMGPQLQAQREAAARAAARN